MKKFKLFLAALAAMVGLGVNAQSWTASEVGEGYALLYNVGTGKYFTRGNDYGTRASVGAEGSAMTVELKAVNGNYFIRAYNALGVEHLSGGTVYVDQSRSKQSTWAFTQVGTDNGPVYNIVSADNHGGGAGTYLTAEGGSSTIVGPGTDGTLDNAKWKVYLYTDQQAKLQNAMANASEQSPVDVTAYVVNHNFAASADISGQFWTMQSSNYAPNAGDVNVNPVAESWRASFTLSQTITVPNGYYKLRAQTFIREYSETGADYPVVYLNEATKPFIKMKTETASLGVVSSYFLNGDDDLYYWTDWTDAVTVTGKSITIGVRGTRTDTWCAWDNFQLQYLGPIDLSEYVAGLAAAVAAAEATQGTIPTACYDAIAAVVTEKNKTYDNADDYSAAIVAINDAVNTFASTAIVAAYNNYTTIKTAVVEIDNSIDVSTADGMANNATSAVAIDDAVANLRGTLKTYLATTDKTNVDLTAALLINPGFEAGNINGWTNTGEQSAAAQGNKAFDNTQGNFYAERWHASGTVNLNQSLANMPSGVYEIGAFVYSETGDAKLYINDSQTSFSTSGWYTARVAVDADATLTFGASCTLTNSTWICMDGFSLKMISAGLPDVTAVTGKMNAEIATAQTTAIEAYNSEKTVANYNAASAAVAAAEASVAAYAKTAAAIEAANTLKDAHNFASAAATTTFAEAIAAVQTKYNNGTLTNDEANNGGALGMVVTAWHGGNNNAAAVYLRDGFALGDIADDPALHVNTWSTEGDSDGSGFSIPFYESWLPNTDSLPESTLAGTLTNLPNGLYKVSAWVRVSAKNGTAATDATGITMAVNGGGEGDYTPVDVTEGTQVGESQFQLATYEAQGLVKDGTLTLNFNIAAGNNISWLSFKNVKYTKVRDLTPEELAVVPADLAIEATSTVFKGKTVALTATSTTEGASIDGFVNWTSDNTSVATVDANGVVTGVAYGTANITATSALNAEATATCAVTVTAPLITEAPNLDFAEGPVINNHICTYSADMTKPENNTTFCHTQAVTGWNIASTDVDGKAAGVMAYGSSTGMGNNLIFAPATNPAGESAGNALGMVGVWTGSVQYVQNVKLPAGAYTISVPVYRNGGASALVKNLIGVILDDGTEHLATTTTYAQDAWTTEIVKFTITEDTYGMLSLGLNAPNKGSNDSQRLWIDGVNVAFEPFATTEEIAALNTAIEAAEGYALGFDKDDYAPYNNVAALTALATAKALDTENLIAQSDVISATAALTSAIWTVNTEEVNAVYDGTFAAAENNGAPAGWTMSNNTLGGSYHSRAFNPDEQNRLSEFNSTNSGFYIRFDGTNSNRGSMYFYGNTAGYTMPLKAGVTYYVKVDVAGWGSIGKPIRMNVTGPEGFTSVGDQVITSVRADNSSDAPQQISFTFETSVAGNYVINFQTPGPDTNTHAVVISNLELKRVPSITIDEASTEAPAAMASANVTLTRTLSADYWNTFTSPVAISADEITTIFGEGTKVREMDGDKAVADNVIPFKDATEIVAGVPYLVKPAQTVTNPTFTAKAVVNEAQTIENGDFKYIGILAKTHLDAPATDATALDLYLATDNTMKKPGSNGANLKGMRAYFNVPTIAAEVGVKIAFEDGGIVTSISSVDGAVDANEAVYNIAGQRVNKVQKGLYIVNGKKVLVK